MNLYRLRTISALFVVAAICGAAGAGSEEEQSFGILVQPLSHAVTRMGVPLPTLVTILNSEGPFAGAIEARLGDDSTGNIFRREINIGKGIFNFILYPLLDNERTETPLDVRIMDGRQRVCARHTQTIRFRNEAWSILSVTAPNRRFTAQDLPQDTACVTPLRRNDMLPDLWYGYKMFDAVLWDAAIVERLPANREAALAEWILSGGRLIIAAKNGDSGLKSPVPRLIPSLATEPRAAKPGDKSDQSTEMIAEFPVPTGERFAVRRFGLGYVVFLGVDFNSIGRWSTGDLASLLGVCKSQVQAGEKQVPAQSAARWGHQIDPLQYLRGTLASMSGYTIMAFRPIALTILVYLALVSIGDYLVLKRLRRLPWTWLTFPLLIALFSVVSFRQFYRGSLGPLVRNEFLFLNVARDGQAKAVALACIRNTGNTPIVFDAEPGHFLAAGNDVNDRWGTYGRIAGASGQTTGLKELHRNDGRRTIIMPALLGSYRFFLEEWLIPPRQRAPFECHLRSTAGGIAGAITNHTERKPFKAYLHYNGGIYDIDDGLNITPKSRSVNNSNALQQFNAMGYDYRPNLVSEKLINYVALEPSLDTMDIPTRRADQTSRLFIGATEIFAGVGAGEGVLVAFFNEQGKTGGLAVNRIKCVRQVVPVAPNR